MTPERREQLKTIANLPLPASYDLGRVCRDLMDARSALNEALCELESTEQQRDYLKKLRDDAYGIYRKQLDEDRASHRNEIDGLLAHIRLMEAAHGN